MDKVFTDSAKKKLHRLLIDVGFLNETLFSYLEIIRYVKSRALQNNFFIQNIAQQYNHSMIMSVCRQSEYLRDILLSISKNTDKVRDTSRIKTPKNSNDVNERVPFLESVMTRYDQNKYIVPKKILSDIRLLDKRIKKIKEIRNKIIAHIHKRNYPIDLGLLDFNELKGAMIKLSKMVLKYDKATGLGKYYNHVNSKHFLLKDYLRNHGEYKIFKCASLKIK